MLPKRIILFFFTLFFYFLTGCNSPLYNQTEANVADVKQHVNEATAKSNSAIKPVPSLIVNEGLYVDHTPISLARDPAWLRNRIVMRGDQLPFSYYSRVILGTNRGILTRYQTGLDDTVKLSINYSGTIKGALELLGSKTGYIFTVNGNNVYWQVYLTKTFDVAFMPGASDYMMGKSSSSNVGATSSAGAGGAVQVSAMVDDSSSSQYSSLKGTLSIWKDLENTIKQLLSPGGSVIVSESTTSVTVRDKPTNLSLVARYIENINNNLSKQVLVKVQVLDVTLNADFSYGIDWNAVKTTLGGKYFLNANYGTPVSITTLGGAPVPSFGLNPNGPNGATSVSALINAINQQGKVSVVTEPRVVCLNNQVSVIRIINQEGYLASVQNTTVAGSAGSGSTVTSQLTPGTLITGLTLYILPKILGDKVYLQVNADLSNKISIQTISSATGAAPTSSTPAIAGSVIQVPNLTQKQFNQRSVISSGDTLILSGFRQVSNQTGAQQLLNSQALGGKGASQVLDETIVLITPIILHGIS